MGAGADAAGWTAEDDVLLKNAVEVTDAARPDSIPSIPLFSEGSGGRASCRRARNSAPSRPAGRRFVFGPGSSLPSRSIRGAARYQLLEFRVRSVGGGGAAGPSCVRFWWSY
jgi:hypothetical protein